MAENTKKRTFEEEIWEAACVLWGHIPAAEYRKVIVGLIFLRYIDKNCQYKKEIILKQAK